MRDIFEKQFELNTTIFAKCGFPSWRVVIDPESRVLFKDQPALPYWVENFRKALFSEFAELLDELAKPEPDLQNAKVEAIDILHFLVSLSQLTDVRPEEALDCRHWKFGRPEVGSSRMIIEWVLAINGLQNSVKWKWWAKGGGYKPEAAKEATLKGWTLFWDLTDWLGLSMADVKSIYFQKHQVNLNRQACGYNEDTKTEADNLTIAV